MQTLSWWLESPSQAHVEIMYASKNNRLGNFWPCVCGAEAMWELARKKNSVVAEPEWPDVDRAERQVLLLQWNGVSGE